MLQQIYLLSGICLRPFTSDNQAADAGPFHNQRQINYRVDSVFPVFIIGAEFPVFGQIFL